MVEFWTFFWMLAGATVWIFMARWPDRRLLRVVKRFAPSVAVVALLIATGWSFRSSLLDRLALPLVIFAGACATTAAAFALSRRIPRRLAALKLLPAAFVALQSIAIGVVFFVVVFVGDEPDGRVIRAEALGDRYHYRMAVGGMAFTSDFLKTRVLYRPRWLPGLERSVAFSTIRGPEGGLVEEQSISTDTERVGRDRVLNVYSRDRVVDRLSY